MHVLGQSKLAFDVADLNKSGVIVSQQHRASAKCWPILSWIDNSGMADYRHIVNDAFKMSDPARCCGQQKEVVELKDFHG